MDEGAMTELSFLTAGQLTSFGDLAERYQAASPFPHIVIDNFLEREKYDLLAKAYPSPDADIWYKFQSGKENKKLQSQTVDGLPWEIRAFLNEVNGPTFVRFLEKMTGIEGLIPDPHLYGGGLHQSLPGGHLGLHVDYNYHQDWKLDRRLNAILYVNDDWNESWGSNLELWDCDVKECVQSIAPFGNRLVVFNTDEKSWHGHPDPLCCPDGRTRRSIALYYYSNGRPEHEKAADHNTLFRERPGEAYKKTTVEMLREWVPPALLKAVRKN
jgi:hypothetical protein